VRLYRGRLRRLVGKTGPDEERPPGVLMMALAATSFRIHQRIAAVAVFIGGLGSIAWMTFINFVIDSDFKSVPLGVAFVWAYSLVLFWFEEGFLGTDRDPSLCDGGQHGS